MVAYFGNESDEFYLTVHLGLGEIYFEDKVVLFVHTEDEECAKTFGLESAGEAFFRTFEHGYASYALYEGDANIDDLNNFIKPLMVPTLFEFTEQEYYAIF